MTFEEIKQWHADRTGRRDGKYSPGPWAALVVTGGDMAIDCTRSGANRRMDAANAVLISAAPELLEACIKAVEYVKSGKANRIGVMEILNAAIAKAQGR